MHSIKKKSQIKYYINFNIINYIQTNNRKY